MVMYFQEALKNRPTDTAPLQEVGVSQERLKSFYQGQSIDAQQKAAPSLGVKAVDFSDPHRLSIQFDINPQYRHSTKVGSQVYANPKGDIVVIELGSRVDTYQTAMFDLSNLNRLVRSLEGPDFTIIMGRQYDKMISQEGYLQIGDGKALNSGIVEEEKVGSGTSLDDTKMIKRTESLTIDAFLGRTEDVQAVHWVKDEVNGTHKQLEKQGLVTKTEGGYVPSSPHITITETGEYARKGFFGGNEPIYTAKRGREEPITLHNVPITATIYVEADGTVALDPKHLEGDINPNVKRALDAIVTELFKLSAGPQT